MNPLATNYENFREHAPGSFMERALMREKMRTAAERCGNALLQFYRESRDAAHEKSMWRVMLDLLYRQTEDEEFLCETIYEEANRHLATATRYGYTSEDLAALRNCIDGYRQLATRRAPILATMRRLDDAMGEWQDGERKAA